MSIAILSTVTGNGHNSVMYSLADKFRELQYEVDCYPTFYEELMTSNKILSGFYNFLMTNSIQLCCKFSEFSAMTRPDLSTDFYEGVYQKIVDFIVSNPQIDCFISTSHTLNYAFMQILAELKVKKNYYIVITDPYHPISVGFAVPGATRYFCANEVVRDILIKSKIDSQLISVTGYPINAKYSVIKDNAMLYKEVGLDPNKKTIMINSGSQGIYHYMDILKKVYLTFELSYQYIFICGKNEQLYNLVSRFSKKNNMENNLHICKFINNMEDLLNISDLVITKAGANSFYETLYMGIPIIIDGVNDFLYQEKGVKDFIVKYKVGQILSNTEAVNVVINDIFDNYESYKNNIKNMHIQNGVSPIAKEIVNQLNEAMRLNLMQIN